MPPVTVSAICWGGITARAGRRTMIPTTRPRTTAPTTTSAVTTHPRTVRGTRRPRGPAITSMTTPATTTTHWAPTSTRWGTSRARPPPGAPKLPSVYVSTLGGTAGSGPVGVTAGEPRGPEGTG